MIQRHHAVIREILGQFSEGEEIETAGDSFFIVFTKPSDAVKFSLHERGRGTTGNLRSLKREATLFRLLKERVGEHPNIVAIESVYFDEPPPYYILMQHVAERDLASWCESQGGIEKVLLETRFEIVAQIADALQAAHDSGVIHRDVKPSNILVRNQSENPIHAYLTDFGIGQIIFR